MALGVFINEFIRKIAELAAQVPGLMPICRHGAMEHPILALIALWFSNPLIPDFGTQFIAALIIGLLLPARIIDPIYDFIKKNVIEKISSLKKFEKSLYKHPRVKKLMKTKNERILTIIPRIIAGYAFTYLIAYLLLIYLCLIV